MRVKQELSPWLSGEERRGFSLWVGDDCSQPTGCSSNRVDILDDGVVDVDGLPIPQQIACAAAIVDDGRLPNVGQSPLAVATEVMNSR